MRLPGFPEPVPERPLGHGVTIELKAMIARIAHLLHKTGCGADHQLFDIKELNIGHIGRGAGLQHLCRLRPGNLKASALIGDVLQRDARLHILFEPALVIGLTAVAGGQLEQAFADTRNGEITDKLTLWGKHGREREAAGLRNSPRHDPVEPGACMGATDQEF